MHHFSDSKIPPGLYDPRRDHDSCGLGLIAHIDGHADRSIICDGLEILRNLEHRGAVGADPKAGDGSGIMLQIPDLLIRDSIAEQGITLPQPHDYAIAAMFLPRDPTRRSAMEKIFAEGLAKAGLSLIAMRDVPTDRNCLGYSVLDSEPCHRQAIIGKIDPSLDINAFERLLFVTRITISNRIADLFVEPDDYYIPSMSAQTLVYKGMFLGHDLANYYRDLADPRVISAFALLHQRFSTNTLPSWRLAHPYRLACHNGEINTVRGNTNWMRARYGSMHPKALGASITKLEPLIRNGESDTACFDNTLELLLRGGYSLPHALAMMVPEAWHENESMNPDRKDFYHFHATLMEPWDGPAALIVSDGRFICATLDRNGLRPARYYVTTDNRLILSSEVGVLPLPNASIAHKWRLQPGKMLLIDLAAGRLVPDAEIKAQLAGAQPWGKRVNQHKIRLKDLPPATIIPDNHDLFEGQLMLGYTQEDIRLLITPMMRHGEEAIGSMGVDTPPAILSDHAKSLYTYFKQNFAQVTNPAIDPLREKLVMSLKSFIGPRADLFAFDDQPLPPHLDLDQPILTPAEINALRQAKTSLKCANLDATWPAESGPDGLLNALDRLQNQAITAANDHSLLILSDRAMSRERIAIPSLLTISAIHHALIRARRRAQIGLIVETADAREVHHFCCLAGYGAEAIHPWLAFDTLHDLGGDPENYVKAISKGLLKVMSKMGVSTYQSYCGAQIFDAVGLDQDFVAQWFPGTASQIGGIGLDIIARETFQRHQRAIEYRDQQRHGDDLSSLDIGGDYAFRLRGETHIWHPDTVAHLQHAARGNDREKYDIFRDRVDQENHDSMTLRGLFALRDAEQRGETPLALDDVEPAAEIVKRFATGAMSFGSISREAHTTLAIAMNRIGGKSNTGEGGEQPDRFTPLDNGDSMRSAIKQVASGRFGVTVDYLVNSAMIQIKIAQGAKPGEGGQLPGHKVDETIAAVRHSTPGVGLISPPPHHDIYSIEDLKQLIRDLKSVNPKADISVKLVSEVGVGTVAAGVTKARADHVTISGYEGGTGASPLTSIRHAGLPWEIGLAETQQTLVANNLRGRIAVQVDGGLRTGRDVIIGALLGADQFGFATAPLIAMGCLMMRKCHLNTCPVGIATQNPELRQRFRGLPEHVINYLFFVAEDVREHMARLGFRRFDDIIGRTDCLDTARGLDHWKACRLDFSRLFYKPPDYQNRPTHHCERQQHGLESALDHRLIEEISPQLDKGQPAHLTIPIRNVNLTVGAMLSGMLVRRYGHHPFADDHIHVAFTGTAGQSFAAFLANGVTFTLEGDANDYVAKGLCGGKLAIFPPRDSCFDADTENILIGNTVLYGAIRGSCWFAGIAGERFAVRNSGAIATVEGCGDHGCEYMTGGLVAVLGPTGRNFAAGMSGGVAYVFDPNGDFPAQCNQDMVGLMPLQGDLDPAILAASTAIPYGDMPQHLADYDLPGGDFACLYRMLTEHVRHTGSTRGQRLLDDFSAQSCHFVKIMPHDYHRVLEERAQARRNSPTIEPRADEIIAPRSSRPSKPPQWVK